MVQATTGTEETGVPTRIAAWALIAIPVLEIAAMAHHPRISSPDPVRIVSELRELATLDVRVHGTLIALLFAGLLAVAQFATRRGFARAAVRSGLILYSAGVLIMTLAGLVDGFIVSRVAFAIPGVAPAEPALVAQLAAFAVLFNQAFAKCGAILMSVGIAAFSLDLLRGARFERALGSFGLLSGIGCTLAIASGLLRLDVHGMGAVLLLQALWTVGAGALLLVPTPQQPLR